MAAEILPGRTVTEALNTDLVCDAINTAMRELFLQIVYGSLNSIRYAAVLAFCFFPCSVRIITLFDEICHFAEAYELVTDNLGRRSGSNRRGPSGFLYPRFRCRYT